VREGGQPWCVKACRDHGALTSVGSGETVARKSRERAVQARVVARNLLGEPSAYPGAYAFARAHFFDTHAVTFGKTTRATQCELGQIELIERDEGEDFLRVIVKEGLVVGGQAIGRFADFIGLFIGAMWRKDSIPGIRANWPLIAHAGSAYPWTYRKIGELMGLKS
jgi:NADH oxidase (H2O2-forming)